MKYAFNIVAILGLAISITLALLFFTQRDRLTITQTEAKVFLEELETFQINQKRVLEDISNIQLTITNLNLEIKGKTLMLAEHNMRLNELEYFVNEIFLNPAKNTLLHSNDFTNGTSENKKYLIEKFRDSDSFLSEVEEAEIIEAEHHEYSSKNRNKTIEEQIIYFLSPDDYSNYKKRFIDSEEHHRLLDFISSILGNEVTPLSIQQQVKLTITAFEETEAAKQKYGGNYDIPAEDFDRSMLLKAKDLLSDVQFTALKEFIKGE